MNTKERLLLTGVIGAQLGPLLDKWLVPPADQITVVGWIVVSIPIVYHAIAAAVEKYGPRIMDKWFPPVPAAATIPTLAPTHAPTAAPK